MFFPLYVLGAMLLVTDDEFVKQTIQAGNHGDSRDMDPPAELQVDRKENALHKTNPLIMSIYVLKVAFVLTSLLVHLKLDGVLGDSASSWAWVFVPYYAMVFTNFFVMYLPAIQKGVASVLAISITAIAFLVTGLLFNLYAVGIITVFACVLIPFYILAAFLLIPTCCLMCD